jgi:hypothetical protein
MKPDFASPSLGGFDVFVVITQAYKKTGLLIGITVFLNITGRQLTPMLTSQLAP